MSQSQPPATSPLPRIMVAPNGARRTKADHPALPISIEETVATAIACRNAGADGIHAHVRDQSGAHVLDAGLYRELMDELARNIPDMFVQITTEAVGIYSPEQQRQVIQDCTPRAVSVGLREMLSDGQTDEARHFYHSQNEQGVALQHILYDDNDFETLIQLTNNGFLPTDNLQLLFVLGRYSAGQISEPSDLDPFLDKLATFQEQSPFSIDWGCCAFGKAETDCLLKALDHGGKARIGFENNLHHPDGSVAQDNADRVSFLVNALRSRLENRN